MNSGKQGRSSIINEREGIGNQESRRELADPNWHLHVRNPVLDFDDSSEDQTDFSDCYRRLVADRSLAEYLTCASTLGQVDPDELLSVFLSEWSRAAELGVDYSQLLNQFRMQLAPRDLMKLWASSSQVLKSQFDDPTELDYYWVSFPPGSLAEVDAVEYLITTSDSIQLGAARSWSVEHSALLLAGLGVCESSNERAAALQALSLMTEGGLGPPDRRIRPTIFYATMNLHENPVEGFSFYSDSAWYASDRDLKRALEYISKLDSEQGIDLAEFENGLLTLASVHSEAWSALKESGFEELSATEEQRSYFSTL